MGTPSKKEADADAADELVTVVASRHEAPSSAEVALDDTVQVRLRTLAPQLKTMELSPNSTIVPPELHDTAGERALELLVPVRRVLDELELKHTLGEGGMGVVHCGVQRSLGRDVAIKTLRPEFRRQRDVLTLLREAWVTGTLEHPNILPIYDVKLDEDGLPLVVLKRIEGVDWAEMMHDRERMAERFGEGDLLEHNLKVLMQVCHAVAFAHSRGFVHRDIKPDNVRIGAFGEVYVLDWGIAVALHDDETGRFPLAKDATAMAGTPSYMAPEMLGGDDAMPITARTDIYLLGATLYEVVTGHPPHDGPTAAALVTSVLRSSPKLDDVPAELADLIVMCMAPAPEDRLDSAEDVRLAIQGFLDHRGSEQLATRASERLVELKRLVSDARADVRIPAHDLLGACRAGFSAALEMWEHNITARDGLRDAVESVAEFELACGEARAAAALLTQLEEPSELLTRRVERGVLRQRQAEERRDALEELGKDLDPATGTRTRMVTSVLLGTLWCLLPLVGIRLEQDTYAIHVAVNACAFVACSGLFLWARESLTKTAFNRRLAATILFVLSGQFVLTAGAWLANIDPTLLTSVFLFAWALAAGLTTISTERKLWPSAVAYTLAFLASAAWIEKRYWIMSLSNAVLTLNFAIAWRPRDLPAPSSHSI